MADKREQSGFETWTIVSQDGRSSATFVPAKGGVGSSLVIKGRELLYRHEFFWQQEPVERIPGGWPFLFPTCGRLERGGTPGVYLYDGRLYQLPSHGFGPRLPWKVMEASEPNELTLMLQHTAETFENYPFEFEVRLRYRMENDALVCEQFYRNNGSRTMPYYAGFHPYFLTPGAAQGKEQVTLDYRPTRRLVYNQTLTDLVGEGDLPRLPVSVCEPTINEILTLVGEDKETRLVMPDGLTVHMAAEGVNDPDLFPYIQLYTIPEKPFFCVEPWMGFPNALNTLLGARLLAPGAEDKGKLRVWTT